MTGREFWGSTWRELDSRRNVFERSRDFLTGHFAALQATLHNAHFLTQKGQKPFTAEMFMPGYETPEDAYKPAWQRDLEALKMQLHLVGKAPGSEKQRAEAADVMRVMTERKRRADQARQDGASSEEIRRIMAGT